ncbi:MAG: V-type ATP synthase subunit E family protein [Thermodesulfobacteriota bacterium]|nr:V-type ATP synthase subunit E family protein [Thermodesulfobacteriota bacterium]
METDKIREAILDKARGEAEKIVSDAKEKTREILAEAESQKGKRYEEEKKKIIAEARRESSKTLAQASLKARQQILKVKDAVVTEVLSKVKDGLSNEIKDKSMLARLITETIDAFESEAKLRIFTAPKDLKMVEEVIGESETMKERVAEIKEIECLGGIMGETLDGMVSIDNTFDMRLEMLVPKILPEIGKKLFGSS